MSKISTFRRLWSEDKHQIIVAAYNNVVHTGILNHLPDQMYLKLSYLIKVGVNLDLDNPVSFSEKIQWLKLHDRQERYTELVDKVLVKEYVAREFGPEYIIPTLNVWDRSEDIDFASLPDQFVLKCNHDSGSVILCRDKSKLDLKKTRDKLHHSLRTDMFYWGREWPYKNVQRKILAEVFMEQDYDRSELIPQRGMTIRKQKTVAAGVSAVIYDTDWDKMPLESFYSSSIVDADRSMDEDQLLEITHDLAQCIAVQSIRFYYNADRTVCFGEASLRNDSDDSLTLDNQLLAQGKWMRLPWGDALLIKDRTVIHFPLDNNQDLVDYKFFCFHGEPVYCQIITGRTKDERIDFYNMDWEHQPFVGLTAMVQNSGFEFSKPDNLSLMQSIARKMSIGTRFCRIDFYEIKGKLYFGEFTLYPASGFGKFVPDEWNQKLGDMIRI